MPKLEDVVILMQQSFKELNVLFPDTLAIEKLRNIPSEKPFSEESISFLSVLSQELMKDYYIRNFPDVATFAFFCRRSNVLQLKKFYSSNDETRLGRGLLFHVAPSNVPVNFAYSLVCGLLAGNVNIVRVPSKSFEQVNIIVNAITRIASKHPHCSSRIALVSYDRASKVTNLLSSFCDVRIIWGGDETISQIRQNSIPPRSFDVTFADRYSFCIINAPKYLNANKHDEIAQGFYNDTYLFDQNACTAPHLIVWMGSIDDVVRAKKIFWESLYKIVKQKYDQIQPVIAVDKLTALFNQSVFNVGARQIKTEDNFIWRVEIDKLHPNIENFRCTSGYFTEYHAGSLDELTKIIDRKYQTLAYFGFEKSELSEFVVNCKLQGIDRIVPIGRTSDFSLTWDGYNLIDTLSRVIDVQ